MPEPTAEAIAANSASNSASTRVWEKPSLELASLADLFRLYGQILDELTRRHVVRTRNQPLGDYAEWLTWRALVGVQSSNKSEKAFDISADLSAELDVRHGASRWWAPRCPYSGEGAIRLAEATA